MARVLLDAQGGVIKTYEDDGERFIIAHTQDVEAIVEENKAQQNSGHDGYNRKRNMRRVAEVPETVLYGWLIAEGLPPNLYQAFPDKQERRAWLKRKLNDPDNKVFRTIPQRI